MKILTTLTLTICLSNAYAQITNNNTMSAEQPSSSNPVESAVNRNTNNDTRATTYGSERVIDRGTTNENVRAVSPGANRSPNNIYNNSDVRVRDTSAPAAESAPAAGTTGSCLDSRGVTYNQNDSGYSSCVNSLRSR